MSQDSIFTKIINREIPATIEFEDDEFIAIHDIHPAAPVHLLIIPKKPLETLESVPVEDDAFHAKILKVARQLAQKLGISDNYKLMMNVGKKVQMVHHIHLHLLGGWDGGKTTEELDKESEKFAKPDIPQA
ncbi:MAG: histidine triad family protein [Patescibacteria group bacterium]|nr:histidine triad family protein [Patescibacteria group bacterium]